MNEGEDPEEDVPGYFFDTKWPHPRARNNQPREKDEALVWFMDFYNIDQQVDMRRLQKKKRLCL